MKNTFALLLSARSNIEVVTKLNHVPYQTIEYDDKGMFQAKLLNDTQIQVIIDNGATPSILPFSA